MSDVTDGTISKWVFGAFRTDDKYVFWCFETSPFLFLKFTYLSVHRIAESQFI
jgi:hypothetical protein